MQKTSALMMAALILAPTLTATPSFAVVLKLQKQDVARVAAPRLLREYDNCENPTCSIVLVQDQYDSKENCSVSATNSEQECEGERKAYLSLCMGGQDEQSCENNSYKMFPCDEEANAEAKCCRLRKNAASRNGSVVNNIHIEVTVVTNPDGTCQQIVRKNCDDVVSDCKTGCDNLTGDVQSKKCQADCIIKGKTCEARNK